MIALAFAALLSSAQLSEVLQQELYAFKSGFDLEPQFVALGSAREVHCQMSASAMDASFSLKKIRISRQVVVMDPQLAALVPGGLYKISESELPVVDVAILDAEQKAARYEALCRH